MVQVIVNYLTKSYLSCVDPRIYDANMCLDVLASYRQDQVFTEIIKAIPMHKILSLSDQTLILTSNNVTYTIKMFQDSRFGDNEVGIEEVSDVIIFVVPASSFLINKEYGFFSWFMGNTSCEPNNSATSNLSAALSTVKDKSYVILTETDGLKYQDIFKILGNVVPHNRLILNDSETLVGMWNNINRIVEIDSHISSDDEEIIKIENINDDYQWYEEPEPTIWWIDVKFRSHITNFLPYEEITVGAVYSKIDSNLDISDANFVPWGRVSFADVALSVEQHITTVQITKQSFKSQDMELTPVYRIQFTNTTDPWFVSDYSFHPSAVKTLTLVYDSPMKTPIKHGELNEP